MKSAKNAMFLTWPTMTKREFYAYPQPLSAFHFTFLIVIGDYNAKLENAERTARPNGTNSGSASHCLVLLA